MVTQVDEQHAAVIADAMTPAGEAHLVADVACAKCATGMGAIAVHEGRARSFGCVPAGTRKAHGRGSLSRRAGREFLVARPLPADAFSAMRAGTREPVRRTAQQTELYADGATPDGQDEHGRRNDDHRRGRRRQRFWLMGWTRFMSCRAFTTTTCSTRWRKTQARIRTVHSRHEQGAAYMALGAALATGKPQAYCVVPGPGLLNSVGGAAHGLWHERAGAGAVRPDPGEGDRPGLRPPARNPRPGRHHRAAGRLVGADPRAAARRPRLVAKAMQAMFTGRPGPAALECAIDVWGRSARCRPRRPLPVREPRIDEDAIKAAAKRLGAAKRPLIVAGGGAQDASAEVTALAHELQAPVLSYRRGRGVLDDRDPLSVNLPLGHELWARSRCGAGGGHASAHAVPDWGTDRDLSDHSRRRRPRGARAHCQTEGGAVGQAAPILRRLLDVLPAHNSARPSRTEEMRARHALMNARLAKLAPQLAYLEAIRAELPEDGIFVDEVTQLGFASRLAFPVYRPRTFISPGYQDNLGYGFATALGVQDARPRRAGGRDHAATAGSCSPRARWRPRCATAFRWSPCFSTTAPSAMSGASRKNATATG